MHKIDVDGGTKTLAEIKDLKELAYGGLVATGPSYAGIASDKGIRIRSIKGKSVQNLGGGTPSPDNPVAIESVSIKKFIEAKRNVVKSFTNNSGAQYAGAVYVDAKLKPNTQYTISFKSKSAGTYYLNEDTFYNGAIDGYFVLPNGGGSFSKCLKTKNDTSNIILVKNMLSNEPPQFYDVQIEEGSNVTEYYPGDYKILLANMVLRSLPDGTCDEYKDGKIIRRVGIKVLNGSEAWQKQTDNNKIRYYTPRHDMAKMTDYRLTMMCASLPITTASITTAGEFGVTGYRDFAEVYPEQNWIYITKADQFDTVDDLKVWLAAHPLTVLYKLAVPTIEDVSIPILPSYHPYTTAYTDSPVDPEIEWEILIASNNDAAVADLIARVAALESEAVNNAQN